MRRHDITKTGPRDDTELAAIKLEWWPRSDWNRWPPSLESAEFAKHEMVNHSKKEYVRGDVTTNTVEGFFSIFKRGMIGVYQHCGEQHLQRYLDEFTFRYNCRIKLGINDLDRAILATRAMDGKRLTYRRISET